MARSIPSVQLATRQSSPIVSALPALACMLGLIACSNAASPANASDGGALNDGSASTADASARDGSAEDSGADDAAAADAAFSCPQCPGTAPEGALCAVTADAQLVDGTGAPVSGEVLLLCGLNLCSLPVPTDTNGKAHFDLCLYMTSPALKFLGDSNYVSFAVAMTQPSQTFPPITIVPLPDAGTAFPSGGGAVTSAGVSLQVAGVPTFDPTQPNDPNSLEFRAAQVDPTKAPPGLDAGLGVKALWGLAPLNAVLSPPGTLTIPNPDPTGWAAGTTVDFVMNGVDEDPNPPAPYGGWARVGTGTVSADGQTIATDADGGGLPILGIVGVGPHL